MTRRAFPLWHLCGGRLDAPLWRSHRVCKPQYQLLAVSFLRLRAFALKGGFLIWQQQKAKIQAEIRKGQGQNQRTAGPAEGTGTEETEAENSEIVDIVRGMSIPLAELPPGAPEAPGRWHFGTKCPEVRALPRERRRTEYETLSSSDGGALRRRSLCGFTPSRPTPGAARTGRGLTPWSPLSRRSP